MNKNMTALVSAFARIYHTKNSNIKIYNDMYAEKIITEDEYNEISTNMKNGISFNLFKPNMEFSKSTCSNVKIVALIIYIILCL